MLLDGAPEEPDLLRLEREGEPRRPFQVNTQSISQDLYVQISHILLVNIIFFHQHNGMHTF